MVKPPAPLALLLRVLPNRAHNELLSRLFNQLLKGQHLAGQLPELEGKRLAVTISDTGTQLSFKIRNGRFAPATAQEWDVRIKGNLQEFWLLATRSEDPDTLFFHRRLAIEGDTATGLHIKNMLDSMEFDWRGHLSAVAGAPLAPLLMRAVERSGLERRVQRALHH